MSDIYDVIKNGGRLLLGVVCRFSMSTANKLHCLPLQHFLF